MERLNSAASYLKKIPNVIIALDSFLKVPKFKLPYTKNKTVLVPLV